MYVDMSGPYPQKDDEPAETANQHKTSLNLEQHTEMK